MHKPLLAILLLALFHQVFAQNPGDYILNYSTYFGGTDFDLARDLAIDREGNIYLTGGTSSADFPTTSGVYDTLYNALGSPTVGSWGPMSAFVAKFSPNGTLIWCTYVGGPSYDRAYGIEVDTLGYVYIGGRAGEGYPTSIGAYQENFVTGGPKNNLYGHQNGFITKLTPDGKEIVWSTYYGADSFGFFRDIDIDATGNVYGILNAVTSTPTGIPSDAFDTDHNGGTYDMVAVKFQADGRQVEWATFLGGSGEDRGGPAIRVGSDRSVYVGGSTQSSDFPLTPNAIQTQLNGPSDYFVTRIAPDGRSLIYSTYFGGNGGEFSETHSLYVDNAGQAYIACATNSTDIPTTPNAYKPQKPSTDNDVLLFKLSSDGSQLMACTYFGGSAGDFPEGLYVDSLSNIYIGGGTSSNSLPTNSESFQPQLNGPEDGFILILDSTFSNVLSCSYLGGSGNESIRAFGIDADGTMCVSGQVFSDDFITTDSAFQKNIGSTSTSDAFLTIFKPTELSTSVGQTKDRDKFTLHPNPVSDALFIQSEDDQLYSACIYNLQGQLIRGDIHDLIIPTSNLPDGMYVLSLLDVSSGQRLVRKFVVSK